MPSLEVLHQNLAAGGAVRRHCVLVAPPQPDLVAGHGEVARGRERAVSSAEHGDAHQDSFACSLRRKCWTLPSALRCRSSTKTTSRGILKRASCAPTWRTSAWASTAAPLRRTT